MKFLVNSLEKPENSPVYSVHTDLDSFIFCNDESLEGSVSQNRDANGEAEAMDCNIMATLDLEDNEEENRNETCRICGGDLTPSEQETTHKQPSSQIPKPHTFHKEQSDPQPSIDPITQHDGEPSCKGENNDNHENNPLWEMRFDGDRKSVV